MSVLYIVGTPIGNLSDMSYRAVQTLKDVDFIVAEDTRVTIKLLNHFNISRPMVSYHKHNIREKGIIIINRILSGESCAIVSDAGMPCISDPGEELVLLASQNNIDIKVIPGPSALIAALAVSGLSTARFYFEGFLSTSKNNRRSHIESIKYFEQTIIFYEAPHKLLATLKEIFDVVGDRKIAVVKEITKIYEQVLRDNISQAINYYKLNPPKGEYVIVLEGYKKIEGADIVPFDEVVNIGKEKILNGEKSTEVSKNLSKQYGYKRSDIYRCINGYNH